MKFKLLQQIVVMSRYAFVGIIIQACLSSLLLATNSGLAQRSVDNVHLGFRVEKANLVEIFDLIEEKTDFEFAYKIKDVRGKRSLSMEFENETLGNILRYISKNSDLTFRRVNNQIIAKKAEEGFSLVEEEILPLSSKEVDISGKITDENGEGLPGASVIEKGTTNGTTTDLDGNYRLNLPENATLVISFVGYKATEILLNGRSTIDVQMELDAEQLEEVVVVGYGTIDKKSLTGSVHDVNKATVNRRTSSNTIETLQGVVPGLVVTRRSGEIGNERADFQIRGASSVNAANPLVIIDDIPYTDHLALSTLNPNDIEKISILKDAASASIYGARAAGGVILITTKRGKAEDIKVSYSGRISADYLGSEITPTTQAEYYNMFDEANVLDGVVDHRFKRLEQWMLNGNNGQATLPPDIPFFDALDFTYADRRFVDEMYKDYTLSHYHNLNISGGTTKSTYNISFGLIDNNGLQAPAKFNLRRYTARINYDVWLTNKLQISPSVYLEKGTLDRPTYTESGYLYTYPMIANKNANGDVYGFGGTQDPINKMRLGGRSVTNQDRLNTRLKLGYDILPGLNLVGLLGANFWGDFNEEHGNVITYYNFDGSQINKQNPNRNFTSKEYSRTDYINYSTYLNYTKTINEDHFITALVGTSYEENNYRNFSARRRDLLTEELHSLKLGDPDEQYNDSNAEAWSLGSYFGRVNYNFKQKYMLEINVRRDGSSRFVGSNRWGTFGGISAGWDITKEDFFNSSFFDQLKVKSSFGEVGHQAGIGLYDYIQLINASSDIYPFGVTPERNVTASLGSLSSENRTWERVKSSNFGVEFSVLDSRLSGSFEYFIKNNDNMLVNITLPTVLGADPPTGNFGALKTKGFDFFLEWNDVKDDFSYSLEVGLSDNKNEVVDLEGSDVIGVGYQDAVQGYPMRSMFGYTRVGLIKDESELEEYKQLAGVPQNLRVGDVRFADLNNDGRISVYDDQGQIADVSLLGVDNRRYNVTFITSLSWKNFDFSTFFSGTLKHDIIRTDGKNISQWWTNQNAFYVGKTFNAETRPNAEYPALSLNGTRNNWNYNYQDWLMQNNSYIRMKNITLGYTLPSKVCEKLTLSSVRVYLSGDDLWEFANASADGRDPERGFGNRDGNYPFNRRMTLGIDVRF